MDTMHAKMTFKLKLTWKHMRRTWGVLEFERFLVKILTTIVTE